MAEQCFAIFFIDFVIFSILVPKYGTATRYICSIFIIKYLVKSLKMSIFVHIKTL